MHVEWKLAQGPGQEVTSCFGRVVKLERPSLLESQNGLKAKVAVCCTAATGMSTKCVTRQREVPGGWDRVGVQWCLVLCAFCLSSGSPVPCRLPCFLILDSPRGGGGRVALAARGLRIKRGWRTCGFHQSSGGTRSSWSCRPARPSSQTCGLAIEPSA